MKLTYSVDEIFEIAEQIERNGAAFYRKAAGITDNEDARALFLSLAEQEEDHERTFAGLRQKLVPDSDAIAAYDKDNIVAIHLQALADREVFRKDRNADDELTGSESMIDVLKMAMGKERDSIVYYCGIKEIMATDDQKKIIERIVIQEQQHLDNLAAELERAGAAMDR